MQLDKEALIQAFRDMEDFAVLKKLDCPPLYLLGGSASIITGCLDRATRDIDLLDLDYSATAGRLFRILGDVDYLDIRLTTLAEGYERRAIRVKEIQNLPIYALSVEDIIVTKIGRYSAKDREDIAHLYKTSNPKVIAQLIENVKARQDMSEKVKAHFIENVEEFRRDFNVQHVATKS